MIGVTMQSARRRLRLVPVAVLAFAAACGEAIGPKAESELDTQGTMANYQAYDAVFTTKSWAGLQALGGRTPASASALISSMRALPALRDRSEGRRFALDFFRQLADSRSGATLAKPTLSPRYLGQTLVYDMVTDQYVVDPKRTGAPRNGVRFIVYEVNGEQRPNPAREIGYADLLDEGPASGEAQALRLVLIQQGKTVIDYRTRATLGATENKIDVDGFAEGPDGNRLRFEIGVTGKARGENTIIDADFDLRLDPKNFSVTGSVRDVVDGREGQGVIKLTARHGSNSFAVDVDGNGSTIKGTIRLNGNLFVTVSGDAKNPTLVGSTGQPLTGAELMMVGAIMATSEDVFDLIEGLVHPVERLFLLGSIL